MSRSAENVRINAAALRLIRQRTGVGVSSLAHEVLVTPSFISNLEAGRRNAVSPEKFNRICNALRITDRRALMADPDTELAAA